MARARDELHHSEAVQGLLTVRDVAERLSLAVPTVYKLKAEGRLPYLKIGTALRFRPADIAAFEESCRVTGGRYPRTIEAAPKRLNLQFEVRRRGRGPRRA